jgi:hypothetical protein
MTSDAAAPNMPGSFILLAATAFATLSLAVALPNPAQAAACRNGETKFQNGVQYTCFCTTKSDGETACMWRPD